MIYYFRTLKFRDDLRPKIQAIWYGEDKNTWDLRYDFEDNRIESDTYIIRNYALSNY